MRAADEVGALERPWIVAGWRSVDSVDWEIPEPFDAEGEPPVLMVPQAWIDRGDRDLAFGVGMALLFQQRYGFLGLVRVLVHLDQAASFFNAMGQERETAD